LRRNEVGIPSGRAWMSLIRARYIRAFEVGKPPSSVKYELALKIKSSRGGPVVRNRIRFPYPVKSDTRIGVICPEDSPLMVEAQKLGAVAVGQDSLFDSIRAGHFPFNKLICHTDSEEALKKANLGKLLGPKGLMPNKRHGTITSDIEGTMRDLVGSDEYRERDGVVRMAIGQLGFTPKMLAENLQVVVARMKKDMKVINDEGFTKAIDEVVLGSSHGPSFSLNGKFNPTDEKITPGNLESPM
jgi:large subunit ribosomal protein L1